MKSSKVQVRIQDLCKEGGPSQTFGPQNGGSGGAGLRPPSRSAPEVKGQDYTQELRAV